MLLRPLEGITGKYSAGWHRPQDISPSAILLNCQLYRKLPLPQTSTSESDWLQRNRWQIENNAFHPTEGKIGHYFGCKCTYFSFSVYRVFFNWVSLFLLSQALLMLYAGQARADKANCNDNVSLVCPGANTTAFISLTWYKVCFNIMVSFHLVYIVVVTETRISVLCQRSTRTEKRGW